MSITLAFPNRTCPHYKLSGVIVTKEEAQAFIEHDKIPQRVIDARKRRLTTKSKTKEPANPPMILTEKQLFELKEASMPLMKWLAKNFHPHVKVIVECDRATFLEEKAGVRNEEFVKD